VPIGVAVLPPRVLGYATNTYRVFRHEADIGLYYH